MRLMQLADNKQLDPINQLECQNLFYVFSQRIPNVFIIDKKKRKIIELIRIRNTINNSKFKSWGLARR